VAVALPEAARRLFGDPGDTGAAARVAPMLAVPAPVAPTLDAAAPDAIDAIDAPVLDAPSPDPYVMARLLEDGDREDLAWLCRQLPASAVAAWVERHGARRLSRRSLSFWAVTLDRPDLLPERQPALVRRRELWLL
jgi:hypothetical protein